MIELIKKFRIADTRNKGRVFKHFSKKPIIPSFGGIIKANILGDNPGSRDRNFEEIDFDDPDFTCEDGETFNASDEELREFYEGPSIRLR